MGNVSYAVPSIHPMIAVAPPHISIHTPEFADFARGDAGDRAVVDGAVALATTIADLWLQPGLLDAGPGRPRRRPRAGRRAPTACRASPPAEARIGSIGLTAPMVTGRRRGPAAPARAAASTQLGPLVDHVHAVGAQHHAVDRLARLAAGAEPVVHRHEDHPLGVGRGEGVDDVVHRLHAAGIVAGGIRPTEEQPLLVEAGDDGEDQRGTGRLRRPAPPPCRPARS